MAAISILEFIVYAIIGYSGIVFLIASAFRETPSTKSQSVIRSIWVLIPMFCIYVLGSAGATIYLDEGHTVTEVVINGTTGIGITNSTITTTPNSIVLVQPVWVTIHSFFFTVLVIYFIWNMLQLLVKRE